MTSTAKLGSTPITANTVRMLACDANIIPAVLGSNSEALDLGRATPTWTRAQRRAKKLEDQGCRFPGCQTGLHRCQLHHIIFWSRGGPTNKDNGVHLCRYHHWLIHHTNWRITPNPDNTYRVYRE